MGMPGARGARDDIVIVSAARTPIGRFHGALESLPAPQLGAAAIRAAIERAAINPERVDEVLMGCVLQAGIGQAPARQAGIAAGLPASIGATTINKICGSGLKSVMLGAAMLQVGDADLLVAGGMESMNNAPYLLSRARFGYRLGDGVLQDGLIYDGLWCAFCGQHMGHCAEWIAEAYDVTRDAMDRLALRSHERAVAAWDAGLMRDEIVPVLAPQARGADVTIEQDECPRRDTSLERLSQLSPVFREDGRVTAGNASAIADGAAATVIMRRGTARELGCTPMARIVAYDQAAVAPLEIFTAPIYATRKVLRRAGLTLDEIDLIELNEAFAAQMLADGRALDLDWDKVNVHGGAIALGHPIGASGARVLVTCLYALRHRNLSLGLVALCLGGGEAVAMIVEME
jgi:acetyl-CoA C-acetyltransferase